MTNFLKNTYEGLEGEQKATYLENGIKSIRNRMYDALGKNKELMVELDKTIQEAIRIKRHFNKLSREFSKVDDDFIQIEKDIWQIEDAVGRNITNTILPKEVLDIDPPSTLEDILAEVSPKVRNSPVTPKPTSDSLLEDLLDLG